MCGEEGEGVTEGGAAGSAAVRSGINFVCFEESVTDGAAVRIGATSGTICKGQAHSISG
mgnify:CR=1 FL=1